jgi:hypothetical protein
VATGSTEITGSNEDNGSTEVIGITEGTGTKNIASDQNRNRIVANEDYLGYEIVLLLYCVVKQERDLYA